MKRIAIIGSGAAGLLVLYNLEKAGIDPKWVTVVDSTHIGGDLMKKWLHVRSNTTWRQIFEAIPSRNSFATPWGQLPPEQPCELRYIISYLQACTKDYMSKTLLRTDTVVSALQENGLWMLQFKYSKQPVAYDVVFFCFGSEPKSLDLPFPSIPLEIALDPRRLSEYVKEGQHILVFGTAHSGPLVVKNLCDLNVTVTNFYATEKPFYFARDGEYDGVKQDAAILADDILAGRISCVTLESVHDMSAIIRASKSADACIYACGFESRCFQDHLRRYDGQTGKIEGVSNAWGFGIAYPNKAPDGIHWDVSVPAFQAHIEKQMPEILALLKS